MCMLAFPPFNCSLSAMYPDLYEALHFLSFRTSFLVLFYSMDSKIQVVSQVRTYSIHMHCTHTYDAPQFKRYDSCFHPQSYKRRSNEIIPCCTTLLYYSFLCCVLTDIIFIHLSCIKGGRISLCLNVNVNLNLSLQIANRYQLLRSLAFPFQPSPDATLNCKDGSGMKSAI